MMRKYFLLTLVFSVFFFLAQTKSVHAQTVEIVRVCLNTVYCRENNTCGIKNAHRVQLSSAATQKPPESSNEVFITDCVMYDPKIYQAGEQPGPRYVCTTGNHELDMKLFCNKSTKAECDADVRPGDPNNIPWYDHLSQLQKDIKYDIGGAGTEGDGVYYYTGVAKNFEKKAPPVVVSTDSSGNIPVIQWQSSTPINYDHSYMAWTKKLAASAPEGSAGGQQLGTLDFRYKQSECASVNFDPYGRVFDSVSLEPIPGKLPDGKDLNVQLMQQDANGQFTVQEVRTKNPGVPNPITPLEDGVFSFFVTDGTYKLNLLGSAIGSDYDFQNTPTAPNPLTPAAPSNVNNVYSDLYYKDSPPIVQQGSLQHRDIPLAPKNGTGQTFPIKVLSQFVEVRDNGDIYYHGKVSHPYAKLIVYPCSDKKNCPKGKEYTDQAKNGGPDENGNFQILIRQSDLPNGQQYSLEFQKVDLKTYDPNAQASTGNVKTKVVALLKKILPHFTVQAQETTSTGYVMNPIPQYLEGFAYDASGKLIPNATVNITIAQSANPVYTTKADQNGFFRITSEFLPKYSYSITFTSPQKKETKMSTAQFLQQNDEFIQKEKIKVYTATTANDNPRRSVTPSFIPSQAVALEMSPTPAQNNPQISQTPAQQQSSNKTMLLVGIVLLLLLGAAGIMLGIYVYKKNSVPPPEAY